MMDWGVRQDDDHYQQEKGCRKGPWTTEEDKLLAEYVTLHGEGRWSTVAKCAGLNRSGKSCRLRWVNYLRPGLKRGQLTPREEGIILELHSLWGNKWSTIARYLPGRTDNEIKNYWRTHYKKKEKSSSMLKEIKSSQFRKQQLLDVKPQPHTHSQNLAYLDNKQSNIDLSYSYSTGLFSDQFHMTKNVGATSSHHSKVDDGNYWCDLWNLDNNDSLGFDGDSEQRTTTNIGKLNNGGTEAPLCGSQNQRYDGFYAEGYTF